MVHFKNLQNIFLRRAILSKEMVKKEAIGYQSIASEEVQNLRDRIFVWDFALQRYRRLHSYVPFYFTGRTPMLHVQYRQGIEQEIVIFEVSRSNFYGDVIYLERLDWGLINDLYTIEDTKERTRIKHAEVLVPDLLPL